jgi:hypothetical protein
MSPEEDLRAHWNAACDADWFEGCHDFMERMEAAGFCDLFPVEPEHLDDPFAAERGIEPGGMIWVLTEKGLDVLKDKT